MIQFPGDLAGIGAGTYLKGAVLASLLMMTCAHDVRSRRIPNRIVLIIALFGALFTAFTDGLSGVGSMLVSMLVGLAVWLPFYAKGWLGAGDVKLFAAASAWLSLWQLANAALLSAFIGGALSLIWLLRVHGPTGFLLRFAGQSPARGAIGMLMGGALDVGRSAREVQSSSGTRRREVPYGVAMAAGVFAAWAGVAIVGFRS